MANQLEIYRRKNPRLAAVYADPELFSSPDMFSPPNERQPHVLRLGLTTGCNHNGCTYCNGYRNVRHRVKAATEFKKHFELVRWRLQEGFGKIRRVFIGGLARTFTSWPRSSSI